MTNELSGLKRVSFKDRGRVVQECHFGKSVFMCRQRRALECHSPKGITKLRWDFFLFFPEKMLDQFITFESLTERQAHISPGSCKTILVCHWFPKILFHAIISTKSAIRLELMENKSL